MASAHDPKAGSQHVFDRQFHLCESLSDYYSTEELIMTCPDCSRFVALCCQHRNHGRPRACHHYQLVFTDGACLSNGQTAATSGLGVAIGQDAELQWTVPVDDIVDPNAKRSSQRAELLAAIEGLRLLNAVDGPEDAHSRLYNRHGKPGDKPTVSYRNWVITTDSKYVVDGMTDWLPNKWKLNGMRTYDGRVPANLDLFLRLDQEIAALECQRDVRIGFWHVPRQYNAIADRLAKDAAKRAPVASPLRSPNHAF
ncbi:ribonuclease H-like domain-containing protein [Fomitopsis serialis]|uniref:ribonuclease H-like domain-containing protein n=1 Tax=Fomitopsis serialis TaxID=139415 RepID=UPI002007F187|nr:ribonuclease H-like domain-containing protein [Neoantrodia serialis]KAH9923649.1 ribonuclease H-like domain-containing protein [Neoantrodia serialis]